MSFTYDTSTNIGKVRLLIRDKDSSNYVFEDEELSLFLDMADGNTYLASAFALRNMATSEAKLVQKYKVGTKSVDKGNKVKTLLELADKYESMANQVVGGIVDSEVVFSEEASKQI